MLAKPSDLCQLEEVTIAGVDHSDILAFTAEAGIRYIHTTGETLALYCPQCTPAQYDLMGARHACPRCGIAVQPGSALARKDAAVILAALARFPLEVLPAVEHANAHLLDLARSWIYSTRPIHGSSYRLTRWAYSRRGQHAIAVTMHELDVATRDAGLYPTNKPRSS